MARVLTYLLPLFFSLTLLVSGCEKPELLVQDKTEKAEGDNDNTTAVNPSADDDSDDDSDEGTDGGTAGGTAEGTEDSAVTSFLVDTMPKDGDIWNGYVVAYVTAEGYALLLSQAEWNGVSSAFNEDEPGAVNDIASGYVEGALCQWASPSRDEAKCLRGVWNASNIDVINASLSRVGGAPLSASDRYLCEGGTYTFSFADRTSISKAGVKKTYLLRLVAKVRFVL